MLRQGDGLQLGIRTGDGGFMVEMILGRDVEAASLGSGSWILGGY